MSVSPHFPLPQVFPRTCLALSTDLTQSSPQLRLDLVSSPVPQSPCHFHSYWSPSSSSPAPHARPPQRLRTLSFYGPPHPVTSAPTLYPLNSYTP